MSKEYPCPLADGEMCKYGGNKRFDYGFMRGSSSFCHHPRQMRFTDYMETCPIAPKPSEHSGD